MRVPSSIDTSSSFLFALAMPYFLYATFIFLFVLLCVTEAALQSQKGVIFFAILYSMLAFTKRSELSLATNLKPV